MSLIKSNWKIQRTWNKSRAGFGGGSTQSTQTSDPWSGQQPYLSKTFGEASNIYDTFNPQFYPDSTQTEFNPMQTGAISSIYNTGNNGTDALNSADSSVNSILNGDPAYFQALAAGVVPQLQSQFTQGNSVNNPAMAYATTRGFGDAALGKTLEASNQAQSLFNTRLGGQQAALGAGQTQQTQDQAMLQSMIDRWNYNQQLPYSKLNQLSNTIGGQYGFTNTTTTPQQSLFGSLFSDKRLKDNIQKVGKLDNGLSVYIFTYKGDKSNTYHMGVMAQDVQSVIPEAVEELSSGHLKVFYNLAVQPIARKKVA